MIKMRKSLVLKKLRASEKVNCFKINLADARVAEIAALSGFDCLWVDQEHIGQDWSILSAQIWAAKANNVDVMVRVPRGSYSGYIKPLELDASGIMVPHIMNEQDAKDVIKMTRFHPLGLRPIDGGNADGSYTALDFQEYLVDSNQQKFIVLQIEDPEPLEELEKIAALDGFDMLFFGPGDFSQGIGAPGDWTHPRLVEARKYVAEIANKFGKFAGTTGSPQQLADFYKMGYHFVSIGADVVGITNYCKELVAGFHRIDASQGGNTYYGQP